MPEYELLKERLDALYKTYHSSYLYSDPLKYLHLYNRPDDQEVVGMIASSLAYGRVETIFKGIEKILGIMGPSPSDYVRGFDPLRDAKDFDGFVHRFNRGEDMACLIYFMKQVLEGYGSIGGMFGRFAGDGDENVEEALSAFTEFMLSLDSSPFYGGRDLPEGAGVRYFFPSPKRGSPCKRLSLFLRWMARHDDGLDLGLWEFLPPSRLVIPLDTHLARLSQYLGLTARKSPSWKMAVEVTESLKRMNPDDPLRYDFALCRLGILEICPHKKDAEKCIDCSIKDFCML